MSKKWTVVPLDTQATGLLCKAFAFWRFFGKSFSFFMVLHAALMASVQVLRYTIQGTRLLTPLWVGAGGSLGPVLIMRKVALDSALK